MSNFLQPNDNQFKDFIQSVSDDPILNNINCDYVYPHEFRNKFITNDNKFHLSIFHINIRSLNANYSKLQQLLIDIDIEFDIIVLSEIWNYNIVLSFDFG